MRALQVTELIGPDGIRLVEVPEPAAGDDLLLQVRAVGVSYPDVLRSQGQYQERTNPPYTLGSEVAGIVQQAPSGSGFQPGDRVAGMCSAAAAEFTTLKLEQAIRLVPAISFEQGAALPLNYRTAVVGLELRGRLQPGETVLVHGAAGGTGTAAIEVARANGCRVIGVVSSDEKERTALDAGAQHVVRSQDAWKDQALALTNGRGVDVVWDPVGGDRILDTMRSLAPSGRWVVIGFTGGPIPQVPLNRVLLRNIDVVGVFYGAYITAYPDAVARIDARIEQLMAAGQVQPTVGATFALEDGANALRHIAARQALGKVVLTVN